MIPRPMKPIVGFDIGESPWWGGWKAKASDVRGPGSDGDFCGPPVLLIHEKGEVRGCDDAGGFCSADQVVDGGFALWTVVQSEIVDIYPTEIKPREITLSYEKVNRLIGTSITPEEIHNILKDKFLKSFIEIKGKQYEYVKSTTELDTIEFNKYIEEIQMFASIEFKYDMPNPNEEMSHTW